MPFFDTKMVGDIMQRMEDHARMQNFLTSKTLSTLFSFFINEGKNIGITFIAAVAVVNGQLTLGAMMAIQYIIEQRTGFERD